MKAALAAVVGSPVRHSLSPRIFQTLSRELRRPLHYEALEIGGRGSLEEAFRKAEREGWIGWNVTIPHKITIRDFLDEEDAASRDVGAANVVRFLPGRAIGYNTDSEGFLAPLAREGRRPVSGRAVILGAGGAARAVCAALAASGVRDLSIFNRTVSKADELAARFGGRSGRLEDAAAAVAAADLVVNATPVGTDGKSSPLPAAARLRSGATAYDLVYRPFDTPFLKSARENGAETIGGLGMLVAQAAATWRIWFSEAVPDALARELERDVLRLSR